MSEARPHSRSLEHLPKARIEKNWTTYFIWLVPVGAAALAAWFTYSNLFKGGPTLHIYFENAAGLERGKSEVKFRGARIGEVKALELTKDHARVDVTVILDRSAANMAREGCRFWIVKPEVSAEEISGLRTIVSGDYITVEPGAGKEQTRFTGLSEAPVIEPKGVLHIVLLSETSGSLKPHSQVFYRGIPVGEVVNSDLGPASQTIRINIAIKPHYAPLVRMNSKFWNAGGIHANLNLSGLSIAAESAETLLGGGVAFATPDTKEQQAPQGTTFRLYDKPDDAWLGWAPAIKLPEEQHASAPPPHTS